MPTKRSGPPAVGQPVKLDGENGKVESIDGRYARLDMPGGQATCLASELVQAPEGFWYLPHRVVKLGRMEPELRDKVRLHPDYLSGRDDLAYADVQTADKAAKAAAKKGA